MNSQRKHYSASEKVAILRLHLLEKKPVLEFEILREVLSKPFDAPTGSFHCRGRDGGQYPFGSGVVN